MPVEPFTLETGHVAPLRSSDIDTDVIMPKVFLKGIDRSGLARGVFHDLRFTPEGEPDPDFVLNREPWTEARFLVAGANFGCGSSREHAVWGLLQLGIRAIVAPSFAGIFFDNCARNGLLAIEAGETEVEALMRVAESGHSITVDLPRQTIHMPDGDMAFEIGERRKAMLLDGLDLVGHTLQRRERIAAFEKHYLADHPWLASRQESSQ